MDDTRITLSENDINDRFAVGNLNGSAIIAPAKPNVIAGSVALQSTANDMLKYLSANLGLLY